ncbi:MAG TPA: MerR family transcriptional regulator, partial [Burkholderiaceae bacterium]|nr:MerR family transcriptional regulator [Burkholderiaceae bacterium]
MDIAEVARRSGVAASTLRYYERRGLIAPLEREGAGRRRYPAGVMKQLSLIALGQEAGLSLDEIRTMVLPNGEASVDRALLASKADEIDAQVLRL